MKSISTNCKLKYNIDLFKEIEKKYLISIREDIKVFLEKNSGGYPIKDSIMVDGEEYEIRVFMSLEESDENYYIGKPLEYFLNKTKGKIVPIGIDSGDNYYCVNNETGKVYYWSASDDSYYMISETIEKFIEKFN